MSESKGSRTGPGRPAGIDSGDTRQRVIDAACRCFAQYGYGPATNGLIAEIAGLTAGSVHYHFGTKHNLFAAVCEYVYGKTTERMSNVISESMSVRDLLRAVLEESMRVNRDSPELAAFVAAAPVDARRYPELADSFARLDGLVIGVLTDAVRRGQHGGLIAADLEPLMVAHMLRVIISGFVDAAAASDPDTTDTMYRMFEDLILAATQ